MKYARTAYTSYKERGNVENMHHAGKADRGQVLIKKIGAASLNKKNLESQVRKILTQ